MYINWDKEKDEKLFKERGVSFDDVLKCIERDEIIDVVEHPNKDKYSKQMIMIVELNNYVHIVPFVVEKDEIFLKTIIPSRKYNKKYQGVNSDETR
ncbi:toxin [Bacteroidota bacterium]